MKTRHFLFLAFFVYLLGMSTLAAQSNPSALLRGTITNQKGEPVPYANAALVSPEGVLLEGAVTDEAGNFSISTTKTARVKLVISSLVRSLNFWLGYKKILGRLFLPMN